MIKATSNSYRRAIRGWVGTVQRHAVVVVVAALALTAGAFVYTARTLTINTDTVDMISADVPFRRHSNAFDAAFPQFQDLIVVVIDAISPERADAAASALVSEMKARPSLFSYADWPQGGPFFRRNGLLYLSIEELSALGDQLAKAEPLLAALAEDPTLRGLFNLLDQALEAAQAGETEIDRLAVLLDRIDKVVESQLAGRPHNMSWRELLAEEDPGPADRRRFIIVKPVLDYGTLSPGAAAIGELRQLADALDIDPAHGLRMRLTGSAALDYEELRSVQIAGRTALYLSLTLVAVLLLLGLRSIRLVAATAVTLVMGLVWSAAFAAATIGHLNLLSVAFAVLFVGLGIDFGIHFALRYREHVQTGGTPRGALKVAAVGVAPSLTLSALCAAAGFYAFLPTDYKGLAELGFISGSSMFIALVANLTVLPALLALMPLQRARGPSAPAGRSMVERLVRRHGRAVAILAGLSGLAAVATIPLARFDFNPLNLKDEKNESVSTFLELAEDPNTSPYTIDILASDLDSARGLASRLEAVDLVGQAMTLASFVPVEQEQKLEIIDFMSFFLAPILSEPEAPPEIRPAGRSAALQNLRQRLQAIESADEARDVGPPVANAAGALASSLDRLLTDSDNVVAALAELERRLTRYIPDMLSDLRMALGAKPVGLENLPAELRSDWLAGSGQARIQVFPAENIRSNAQLRAFAESVLTAAPMASGGPVTITEAGKAVVAAFKLASIIALALITLLLVIVLRNLQDVLLVLTPLALATAWTVATATLLGMAFNFANVIVLPLLLGLGVASGIHLVMRNRHEAGDRNLLETSTPRAVVYSALTTIASFGSLAVSGNPGMTSMGQLLTIAITFTLFSTLIVLPSLLEVLARHQTRRSSL